MGHATSRRWTSSTVSTGRSPIATTRSPVCRPAPAAGVAGSTLTISTARVFASPSARASRRSNGRDCPPKPRYARETRPRARSCGTTHVAVSMGTAKLMPCAIAKTAELMPTTRPRESTSGPPELPGLSATSVWMMLSMSRPVVLRSERPSALTTPADTVDSKPNGLPMAITSWPTRRRADCPKRAAGSAGASTRMTARSVPGSSPVSVAAKRRPSVSDTSRSWAPWTT